LRKTHIFGIKKERTEQKKLSNGENNSLLSVLQKS